MDDNEPERGDKSPDHGGGAGALRRRRAGPEGRAGFVAWARSQPLLALGLVAFCVVAIVGLVVSLPRGLWSSRGVGGAHVSTPSPPMPAAGRETPGAGRGDAPAGAAQEGQPEGAGSWVEAPAASPSARGVSLIYRYRTLPPGGESRYEWIVQVRGARPVLETVDVVNWRMEPAAKNGADFVSRDRAADGFPLFGHGPGGWFGLSATIRYRDGAEETLARRIELPE
jgi:hypothetical protein